MLRKSVMVAMVVTLAAVSAWAGEKVAEKAAAKAEACCKAGDAVYVCTHCKVVDVKAGILKHTAFPCMSGSRVPTRAGGAHRWMGR